MKRFFSYILLPCLLASLATPVFSEKPLRLFFEKDSALGPAKTASYTVQDGDSLFAILKKQGFSTAQARQLLPSIQQNNPHIENTNKIYPGQVLLLPLGQQQKSQTKLVPAPTKEPAINPTKPYIVQPGDTVISILEQHDISRPLIFSQYISLFRKLNPDIPNLDRLREGQTVYLPHPPDTNLQSGPETILSPKSSGQKLAQGTARATSTKHQFGARPSPLPSPLKIQTPLPTPPAPSPALPVKKDQDTSPEPPQPETGLLYLREILKIMRCTFTSGDTELYPLPQGGWFQIKLQETPVVTMPWGKKVILCPTPKNDTWIKQAAQLGMQACTIPGDWSLDGVLRSLTQTFPNQIRLWPADQDLALSTNGLGLTIKTPHTVVMQQHGKKMIYALWQRPDPDSPSLSQGLSEVLLDAQVKIIETNHLNEISTQPTRPRHSIYVPQAEPTELIRALNPDNPQELFGSTWPESLDALLRLLKSKDMLHAGVAHLNWSGYQERRINIQVPAWIVGALSSKTILVDKKFADEYLISLLAQKGYTAFVLPD